MEHTVILRTFLPEDMQQMLDIFTDNTVNKTYMLPDFAERSAAIPLFDRLMGLSKDNSRYVRCIALGDTAIGFLNDVEIKDGTIEVGYAIHPAYHGKGYMTQALDSAIRELFCLGYDQVICGAFTENPASIRVMEKCGMVQLPQTEVIPYRGTDHLCVYYGLCKENTSC